MNAALRAGPKADSTFTLSWNMEGKLSRNVSTTLLDSDKLTRRSSGNGTNMSSRSETTIICGCVKDDCTGKTHRTFSKFLTEEIKIKPYQTVATSIACLHIIKMYCAVKCRKSNLCSGVARQLIQTRSDRLGHNLQKNIRCQHKYKLCTCMHMHKTHRGIIYY